ncbi:metallophosphoesterase family protein [Bacillus sp. V5-8f]|uniref:metallophosphoesterase family protein n=1 Tax=Bacillus sp. V5-8f TaxID=2053044 RepID=UPI000C774D94|nr:metallophosphoesterase family protein [Bacillus sp. V5-8f]PLT35656.1 YfcE family phosphodiesterase [Bacillus sp. V5-8f]
MKIIVISDTHMPKRGKKLPEKLIEGLRGAELIIHAGDWQTMDVYEELMRYAPVKGVFGNVDGEEMKKKLPEKQVVEIYGQRIGIVHGHGQKGTTEKRAIATFEGESVDMIIFGHSHIPLKKELNGVLLFNPGSPTEKRRQPMYSYGIISVEKHRLQAEHIFFENKD